VIENKVGFSMKVYYFTVLVVWVFSILSVLLVVKIEGSCLGQIQVDGEGATYIMTGNPAGVSVSGSSLQLKYDNGALYTAKCQANFDPTVFRRFYVLNRTLSFTADVSSISCGCNAAFYFVLMPAYNQNQQPDPTKCGDYYCDANQVCGIFCPEVDLMEANRAALQITPHKCNNPIGKYYPYCDGDGCGRNTKNMGNNYGYGSNFLVNTQHPFNISYNFQTSGGVLSRIVSTISQNGRQFAIVHDESCGSGYLASLTDAFSQGLVLTTSYWSGATGSTMSWLDVPPCNSNENCDTSGTAIYSDIMVY